MLDDNGKLDPKTMASALRAMPRQQIPSETIVPGLLEGLENVNRLIEPWLKKEKINKLNTNKVDLFKA